MRCITAITSSPQLPYDIHDFSLSFGVHINELRDITTVVGSMIAKFGGDNSPNCGFEIFANNSNQSSAYGIHTIIVLDQ